MSKRSVVALGCTAFVMSLGALAASAQSTDGPPAAKRAAAPASTFSLKPFDSLFVRTPPRPEKPLWRVLVRPQPAVEPTCGLIVARPSPRLDPKFPKVPADVRHLFAIRTEPVLCR